jgi:uncharacterized protein YjbI with pentapeptide repeats
MDFCKRLVFRVTLGNNAMKKYCYTTNGDIIFEYSGSLRHAIEYHFNLEQHCSYCEGYQHYCFDLSANTLKNERLEGLILCNSDLHGSNFSGTDLYWGCFRGANLENVNFSHCDLRGASFNDAILRNANFENADMGYSNMGLGADLSGADLSGANLSNANLSGVQYDSKTIFPNDFVIPECMIFKGI